MFVESITCWNVIYGKFKICGKGIFFWLFENTIFKGTACLGTFIFPKYCYLTFVTRFMCPNKPCFIPPYSTFCINWSAQQSCKGQSAPGFDSAISSQWRQIYRAEPATLQITVQIYRQSAFTFKKCLYISKNVFGTATVLQ